jgi:hypothetical protein
VPRGRISYFEQAPGAGIKDEPEPRSTAIVDVRTAIVDARPPSPGSWGAAIIDARAPTIDARGASAAAPPGTPVYGTPDYTLDFDVTAFTAWRNSSPLCRAGELFGNYEQISDLKELCASTGYFIGGDNEFIDYALIDNGLMAAMGIAPTDQGGTQPQRCSRARGDREQGGM